MKREEHIIKVKNIEQALNGIWHYGYEARPADPENTPHVKDIKFVVNEHDLTMVVIEYDWEEGIPLPFSQWDTLETIEYIYIYSWKDEADGYPQKSFRGA